MCIRTCLSPLKLRLPLGLPCLCKLFLLCRVLLSCFHRDWIRHTRNKHIGARVAPAFLRVVESFSALLVLDVQGSACVYERAYGFDPAPLRGSVQRSPPTAPSPDVKVCPTRCQRLPYAQAHGEKARGAGRRREGRGEGRREGGEL